jgi:serine/threonine protein kinase
MTSTLFCDQCGAAIPAQATSCAVCRCYFGSPSASPSSPSPAGQPVHASFPRGIATSSGSDLLRPGSLFLLRYRILEQAGEGGFGVIYKAEDLDEYCRLVAIKQINLRLLSTQQMIEATDSYNREVKYLSRLKQEHIPRIFDFFTDPDHWYIIMEYIKGETLEDKLKKIRGGHFSTQQVYDIGIALCDVLGYLHTQQPPIIFRDVKPANIMQTEKGRIYLIDFGIARHHAPGKSKDTTPLGSPGYAAPEQYGTTQTTAQTDIYGLGATLQTLLTGKEPFDIPTAGASQDRSIPKKLQLLLTKMLEPDASNRPQSMDEVKQSLQWLKEHSTGQRTKQTFASLRDSGFDVLQITFVLLLLLFVFLFTGFFNSPFWIPCLLFMLFVVVCRSTHYLHEEMEEATTRLNLQEALSIVLKRLKGSILFSLIPAALFLWLYAIQMANFVASGDIGDAIGGYLLFGIAVLAFIISGLGFLEGDISWLLHLIPLRRRTRKQSQKVPPVPPLQQQQHM